MPTTETPFTLDQMHSLLKTLGIAAANLWTKTRKVDPRSSIAEQANEELVTTLQSMASLIDTLLPIHEER